MRIGSLFSGIGGLELGLEAALGAHTVWQVEQNEYCRRVLTKHWPGADRSVTDVRLASSDNLPPVGLLCGGFPCQNISLAGKGEGLNGAKSGLWFEFLRLVRELEPRWVVIENVAALRGRGLDAVLWGLAQAGYDAEWATFGAVDVGAPHHRQRIAIIAWHTNPDSRRQGTQRPEGSERPGRTQPERVGDDVAHADNQRAAQRGQRPPSAAEGLGGRAHGGRRPRDAEREESARIPGEDPGSQLWTCTGARPGGLYGPGDTLLADADTSRRPAPGHQRLAISAPAGIPSAGGASEHRWGHHGWATEPNVGRVVAGLPATMDRAARLRRTGLRVARLRALGNAVVPQWSYQIGLRIKTLQAECATLNESASKGVETFETHGNPR